MPRKPAEITTDVAEQTLLARSQSLQETVDKAAAINIERLGEALSDAKDQLEQQLEAALGKIIKAREAAFKKLKTDLEQANERPLADAIAEAKIAVQVEAEKAAKVAVKAQEEYGWRVLTADPVTGTTTLVLQLPHGKGCVMRIDRVDADRVVHPGAASHIGQANLRDFGLR